MVSVQDRRQGHRLCVHGLGRRHGRRNIELFFCSRRDLRFRILKGLEERAYGAVIEKFVKTSTLLHVEPSGDNLTSKLTLDILMIKDAQPNDLSNEVAAIDGVSEVTLIASKTDIDY